MRRARGQQEPGLATGITQPGCISHKVLGKAGSRPLLGMSKFVKSSLLTSSMPWGKGLSSQSFSGKRWSICPWPSPLPASKQTRRFKPLSLALWHSLSRLGPGPHTNSPSLPLGAQLLLQGHTLEVLIPSCLGSTYKALLPLPIIHSLKEMPTGTSLAGQGFRPPSPGVVLLGRQVALPHLNPTKPDAQPLEHTQALVALQVLLPALLSGRLHSTASDCPGPESLAQVRSRDHSILICPESPDPPRWGRTGTHPQPFSRETSPLQLGLRHRDWPCRKTKPSARPKGSCLSATEARLLHPPKRNPTVKASLFPSPEGGRLSGGTILSSQPEWPSPLLFLPATH